MQASELEHLLAGTVESPIRTANSARQSKDLQTSSPNRDQAVAPLRTHGPVRHRPEDMSFWI